MDPTVDSDYTPPVLATAAEAPSAPSAPAASAPPPFAAEPAPGADGGEGKAQESPLASAPPPMASAPVASAMAPAPAPISGVVLQKPVYEMSRDQLQTAAAEQYAAALAVALEQDDTDTGRH